MGHSYVEDGTYTVSLTITNDKGLTDTDSQAVTVSEPAAGVTIDGISPDSMLAGTSMDVTIIGSGFVAGAELILENGSGPTPAVANVVVVDSNTITAGITAKSGGPPRNRIWDVRVTNSDGSTEVLLGAFTIKRYAGFRLSRGVLMGVFTAAPLQRGWV